MNNAMRQILHCVKNMTTLSCYNFGIHKLILAICGGNVSENISNQNVLFSHVASLVLLHCLGKKEEIHKLRPFMLFCQQTHKTRSKYHVVTA